MFLLAFVLIVLLQGKHESKMVEGQNKNIQKGRKEKKKIKEEMGEAKGELMTDAYHKERAKRTGRKNQGRHELEKRSSSSDIQEGG